MNKLNLQSPLSILLVESSQVESQYFIDVLKDTFVNAKIEVLSDSFEAVQWLQNNLAHVMVIEHSSKPLDAIQTSDYLRQELKKDIPIYISSSEVLKGENYISKPFTEASLEPFLNYLLEGAISESIDDAPLYSLNYLKEISGGDMEFVTELIEIFKSSVKTKLEELEIANENKNTLHASKVAHNIKPSFEMIENSEGTEICNKLTYDLENHQLPTLILDLKAIFSKILYQFEIDFTPKKAINGEDISY
ncbi:hypothetical protein [Gramella sp. MAR_2010_147]|uniref:hypothetical protein n=1 Tax=Gramella sp. MAR_2010_147 TaxID=1250205 RepID=UPI00087B9F3C|nr:hypothetical protein [Gramella sp. MAR_2010_147]SDR76910.1 hypothetical protein SAMN04488553_0616 [Gramella sp. MAR_2010_147]